MRVAFTVAVLACGILAANARVRAGDWPQCCGPDPSGIVAESPLLVEAWPKHGPPKVWQSAQLLGGLLAGYGSPVVASGKVYAFASGEPKMPSGRKPLLQGIVMCVSADGKTVWKKTFPHAHRGQVHTASAPAPRHAWRTGLCRCWAPPARFSV